MKRFQAILINLALVTCAIAAVAILLSILLAAGGYSPIKILAEWVRGAVGTRADLLMSLKGACPLILTGLSAGIAFRSGVFNIGAEGQSILGSIGAAVLATRLWPSATSPWLAIPAALVAAAAAGALWALLPALLERFRGVPVVLSTILLNFVALHLLGLLLEGPLKATGINATAVPQSDTLPSAYNFPQVLAHAGAQVHLGFFIALAIAMVAWVIQARTTFGFELRVTGLNPIAARYAGIPVTRQQFAVMLLSGSFAGLAGAMQVMGVEGNHFLNETPVSYGYAGIAVALLGGLHPTGIVAAAIFFAMLDNGAANLEFYENLPLQFSDIAKGLIVLIILAATTWITRRRGMARENG